MASEKPATKELNAWLQKKIDYINGLKNKTEAQQLLTLLAVKEGRSKEETRKLLAIIKAEKLAERTAKARAEMQRTLHPPTTTDRAAARKARDHRHITLGLLFDFAGLGDRSQAELLGLLKSAASTAGEPANADRWAHYATVGKAQLDEIERRAAAKRAAAKAAV